MSISVSKVNVVNITVDPATAALIASLLLRVNWDTFPQAEKLRDQLFDSSAVEDDIDLTWDDDASEFVKS